MFSTMILLSLVAVFVPTVILSLQMNDESDALRMDRKDNNITLPKITRPIYYEVMLTAYLADGNFTFHGESNITVEVLENTRTVVLHAENLNIDESMTTMIRTFRGGKVIKPKHHNYHNVSNFLILIFEEPLVLAYYTLKFKFTGEIGTEPSGFYRSSYVNEEGDTMWVASTLFFPLYARRVFPCWDEPAIKARFAINIRHNPHYTALSNMPKKHESTVDEDGMILTTFFLTPLMSTHTVGFALVDYGHIFNSNQTINIWCPNEIKPTVSYAIQILENTIKEITNYTTKQAVVPKVDHVILPYHPNRATDSWGLVMYSYNAITYDPNVQAISVKESNILTLIHETSRMWFGDLVTPADWQYFWMSEGFASYFKYVIADKVFPNASFLNIYGVREITYIFEMDTPPTSPMNRNILNSNHHLLDHDPWVTYNKAGAVLRMTAHALSENVFRQGIILYLERHEYSSVTPDDFSDALQEALNKSVVRQEQFNVKAFLDTWENQAGYPLVTVTRNYATGEIQLTQEAFAPTRNFTREYNSSAKWWIPISYATETNIEFRHTSPKLWMKPHENVTKIEGVDEEDWIVLNVQITAIYRVVYDNSNWKRIIKYLNSSRYANIHVVNRANLINDAFDFLPIGRIQPVIFFRLLCYLERERDPAVWEVGVRILESMYPYIMIPERKSIFRQRISRLFGKIFALVDVERKSNEHHIINTLRPRIIKLACQYGYHACRKIATENIPLYIALLDKSELNSEVGRLFTCVALRQAGYEGWKRALDVYTKHRDERTLMYLSCTSNATLFETFLEIMGQETSPISKHNFMNKVKSILYLHSANVDMFLNYTIKNKEKLKGVIKVSDLLRLTKTKDRLEKVTKNFPPIFVEDREVLASVTAEIHTWDIIVAKIRNWIENVELGTHPKEATIP